MRQHDPWIDTMAKLNCALDSLIHAPKQSELELERLFHSCRKEDSVFRETIVALTVERPNLGSVVQHFF
jgi:hypothetical protein